MEKPWFSPDTDPLLLIVEESMHGVRLDHYLARMLDQVSRSRITSSIKSGQFKVNDTEVKAGYRLKSGDSITGQLPANADEQPPVPQDVPFTVILEDSSFLVIAKPAGVVVHPGSGNADNTLINGLLYLYKEIGAVGDEMRPGIVHRLDKDTSGVMVVARTPKAHAALVDQFKNRIVKKTYLAIIHGVPGREEGRIVAPIGRHPVHRQKMAVREQTGNYAVSNWKYIKPCNGCCLVEVDIETGRTHQIRVHMAHLGHPVAGDRLYGPNRHNDTFPRQMLHAWKLQFNHPDTGARIEVSAEPAEDFRRVLDTCEDR
jgi:23S rRNA pseudouridine1911/1915/1917 synthase